MITVLNAIANLVNGHRRRVLVVTLAFAVGTGYSVISPEGVILPIRSISSVNHRFPSGPAVISAG